MPAQTLPGWLVVLALGALVVLVALRARRWRRGRPAEVRLLRGLPDVPRRYLVDVHEAVSRTPVGATDPIDRGRRIAALHVLAAGGFVAATVLIVPVHLFGVGGAPLAALLLTVLAAMAVGTALEGARRVFRERPARLSAGGFSRLPFALAAFVVFFAVATLPRMGAMAPIDWTPPLGLALLALGAFACIELYVGMGHGPLKHAVNGLLNLAAHPRPARFGADRPDAALATADLDAARIGVERIEDFTWNRLLAFDACVECGRCEAACPAFEAGLPLNPKALIQDLARAEGGAGHYHGRGHPGLPAADDPRGGVLVAPEGPIRPETLWACTTCRACVYECPMMIEHVDAVIDMRRFQTLEAGAIPARGGNLLDELRATDTQCGRNPAERLDWAADLRLARMIEGEPHDVLLWLGESAFDLRSQRTLRALVRLLRIAGVDFAVLGEAELDCGDLARRMGDEATFRDLAGRNIATLSRFDFKRIVTADPHALHTLANEYPAYGGEYVVRHHTELLAELIDAGRLAPAAVDAGPVTYHDPCYLGRYNGVVDAPRRVLEAMGVTVREMAKSGLRSSCCGSGGGMAVNDIPGERRIADVRMSHARAVGAETVAVACPNCCTMLEGVTQPRADVTDVAELLLRAVEVDRGERAA